MISYTQKQIDITISLGQGGTFGETGANTVKLSGLRCLATVLKGGFPSLDRAQVRVYGIPPSVMNAVSTLGVPLQMFRNNTMLIEAGDAVNGMAVVYYGYISAAYQDFGEAPEVSLQLTGWGGLSAAMEPVAPSSYPGTADAANIMSGIAVRAGWQFENNGVTVKLANPYLPGTALSQAQAVARAADIQMALDTSTVPPTLAIWPKTGTRGGTVPLISAASGLIGYPTYQSSGMSFRCVYNPSIRLGGQIQMQSSVGGATAASANGQVTGQTGGPNGFWYVIGPLSHDLSAQVPGGPWSTSVSCALVNIPPSPA